LFDIDSPIHEISHCEGNLRLVYQKEQELTISPGTFKSSHAANWQNEQLCIEENAFYFARFIT